MSRRRATDRAAIPAQRSPDQGPAAQDAANVSTEGSGLSISPTGRTWPDTDSDHNPGRLRVDLEAVPGVLRDLDDAATGLGSTWSEPGVIRGRSTGGCKPGCDHSPDNPSCVEGVTTDPATGPAADAARKIRNHIHDAVGDWYASLPRPIERRHYRSLVEHAGYPTRAAVMLARQDLDRPWAHDLAPRLHTALDHAARALGDTEPAKPIGPCPRCTTPLRARAADQRITCPACGHTANPDQLRTQALDKAGHITATATRLAEILGPPTTPAMIRDRAHRGLITAQGQDAKGHPTYRLQDVRAALTRHTHNAVTSTNGSQRYDAPRRGDNMDIVASQRISARPRDPLTQDRPGACLNRPGASRPVESTP